MRRVCLAEIAATALITGVLAACGGTSDSHSGGAAASAAVTNAVRTTLASSAAVKTTIAMKDSSEGDVPPITITGAYDMATDAGKLDVVLGPRTMSEIFTKDTMYAKSAALTNVPADKWLAVDRAGLKSHYLLRTPGNDPAAFVRQIADLTSVQDKGSDTVGQVAAKHYRGRFETDTLTRYLASDKVADATTLINAIHGIFADVWVDGSGRIVRIVVSYSVETLSSNTELDFTYAANEPAPAAPDAADTVSGTLAGGALVG